MFAVVIDGLLPLDIPRSRESSVGKNQYNHSINDHLLHGNKIEL